MKPDFAVQLRLVVTARRMMVLVMSLTLEKFDEDEIALWETVVAAAEVGHRCLRRMIGRR